MKHVQMHIHLLGCYIISLHLDLSDRDVLLIAPCRHWREMPHYNTTTCLCMRRCIQHSSNTNKSSVTMDLHEWKDIIIVGNITKVCIVGARVFCTVVIMS